MVVSPVAACKAGKGWLSGTLSWAASTAGAQALRLPEEGSESTANYNCLALKVEKSSVMAEQQQVRAANSLPMLLPLTGLLWSGEWVAPSFSSRFQTRSSSQHSLSSSPLTTFSSWISSSLS